MDGARSITSAILILVVLGLLSLPALGGGAELIWSFEDDATGAAPVGWSITTPSTSATIVDSEAAVGRHCVRIDRTVDGAFGNFMQTIDAEPYRGKRIRFKAFVRSEPEPGVSGRAQMWLRVDREDGGIGFFDNMRDRPITSAEWTRYEITGNIADDARAIALGVMVSGRGSVWVDELSVEIIGDAVDTNEPARPVSERGLRNLLAFARLYGYVRHFHPSDEAAETNWSSFPTTRPCLTDREACSK
jgi:hypothetical protein